MNPPPLPPSVTRKTSFPQQAAAASLFAPALVVLVACAKTAFHDHDSVTAAAIIDVICGALVLIGFLFGILALLGIPQYGPKGILGKSIAGLTINGILTLIFIANLAAAYQKSVQSRTAALAKVKSAEADIRSGYRKSFDPKTGVTNTDARKLDRLSSALKDASENLSGDDALISQAMAAHVARLHGALTNYQSAALALRTAEVLNHLNPTNKAQFAERREIVERFRRSNADLTQVITNSENNILADLTKLHVSDAHIKSFMTGYSSTARPINSLTVQIRQCDDRMGVAFLDALNLLESEWYKWTVDPQTGKLRFEVHEDFEAYNKAVQAAKDAGQDQIQLEKQLVRLQQTQTTQ